MTKLELHVFPWNEPAIRLYERFGFEREGVRRGHYRRDGEEVDAILMAYRLGGLHETSACPGPRCSQERVAPEGRAPRSKTCPYSTFHRPS